MLSLKSRGVPGFPGGEDPRRVGAGQHSKALTKATGCGKGGERNIFGALRVPNILETFENFSFFMKQMFKSLGFMKEKLKTWGFY